MQWKNVYMVMLKVSCLNLHVRWVYSKTKFETSHLYFLNLDTWAGYRSNEFSVVIRNIHFWPCYIPDKCMNNSESISLTVAYEPTVFCFCDCFLWGLIFRCVKLVIICH
jgi:hypothetical protein